jgi:hypothetical protein
MSLGFVERFERADKKHNRQILGSLILADHLADLITRKSRHIYIRQDNIRLYIGQTGSRRVAITDRDNVDTFVSEGKINDLLYGY